MAILHGLLVQNGAAIQVSEDAAPSDAEILNGKATAPDGTLYVTTTKTPATDRRVNGLLVNANGVVVVSSLAPAGVSGGYHVDTDGALCYVESGGTNVRNGYLVGAGGALVLQGLTPAALEELNVDEGTGLETLLVDEGTGFENLEVYA